MLSIAAITLLMASCACTREDGSLQQQGSVCFPESEVTVPSEGGAACIYYTAEDLAHDAELEYESSDPWVHSFYTNEDNTINFTVDANDSGEPRTAIVDVSVKGMAGSSSFAVLQDYVAPPALQIIIDEIGMNSVKGRTTAADQELTYTVLMLSEANYNSLDRDEQRVFDTFLSDCEIIASYNEMSLKEYLELILVSGEYPFEYKDLHASTGYVLVAVGLNTDGTRTTDVFTEIFTTEDFTNNNIKFDFNITPIEGYSPDTDIQATATDDTTRFIMNVFDKAEVEASGMSVEQWLQMKLDEYIANGQMGGTPASVVIDINSNFGEGLLEMRDILRDNTEYIAAAAAITDEGKVNSSAGTCEFTTGALDPSSNQLDLTISEIGLDKVVFSVSTTNEDKYHIFLSAKPEEFDGMSEEEMLSYITSHYVIVAEHRGNVTNGVREGLTPGGSYMLAVFGYHNGADKPTTGITYETFTLESEIGDASQLVFDITIDEVTTYGITWTVNAQPNTALYYSGIYPADWSEEMIKSELNDLAIYWIQQGYVESVADYFRWTGHRGRQSMGDETLTPGTDYHIVTVGIYDTNGGYATDMLFTDVTTLSREESDVTVSINTDTWYDGTELASLYPEELSSAIGSAVLELTAETTGDAAAIYYDCYTGNYMDTQTYTDDYVISELVGNGPASDYILFISPYNTELTVIAVAEDSEGNYGPVFRKCIILTRDGTTPADEFVMPEYAPAFTKHSVSPMRLPDNNQSNN